MLVSLVLAATAGAAGVAAAHDLGSWLVCLELATLPAIALVALRGDAPAGRGALALLTTSLVSFAMLALGAALWLVVDRAGGLRSRAAADALADPERRVVLLLGALLLLAGLGFKLSLVPFHVWTPQAYAGATEPVAAFLAATSKVAALAALLVVVAAAGRCGRAGAGRHRDPGGRLDDASATSWRWSRTTRCGCSPGPPSPRPGGWCCRCPPSTSGRPRRRAATSSPTSSRPWWRSSSCTSSRPRHARRGAADHGRTLAAYTGLLRAHPLLGGALGLALLSLAGLPPGVVGLIAKVVALRPVVGEGQWLLALVAVLNAVIGVAVYLRWFAVLLRDPDEGPAQPVIRRIPRPALAALVLSGAALVATSVMPQLLLGLLD